MNIKLKRFLAFIILALSLSGNVSVFAEPLSEEIQIQNKYLQDKKNKLEEIRQKREELEIKIEHLDARIEKNMREIEKNKEEQNRIEENIEEVENEILGLEKELKNDQELFKKRMRSMYVNGLGGYIDILVDSESLDDFLTRIEFVKNISEYHKEIELELEDKKRVIEIRRDELENQYSVLENLLSENEEQLSSLNERRKEQDKLLDEIKEYENTVVLNIEETEKYVEQIKENLNNQLVITQASMRISRGGIDFSVEELFAYAAQFLGTPYLWGGTSPETGFDCSGFVQYVYGHFGIKLRRVTYDQIYDGPHVEKSDLKPGDLVFFGTWEDPHHVGIYLGDNKYMHAPRTGDVIKIAPMTRKDFVTGVRVF